MTANIRVLASTISVGDAYVKVNSVDIPIEIKSPTEEEFLSTKAVRQALENKIILLSRGVLRKQNVS